MSTADPPPRSSPRSHPGSARRDAVRADARKAAISGRFRPVPVHGRLPGQAFRDGGPPPGLDVGEGRLKHQPGAAIRGHADQPTTVRTGHTRRDPQAVSAFGHARAWQPGKPVPRRRADRLRELTRQSTAPVTHIDPRDPGHSPEPHRHIALAVLDRVGEQVAQRLCQPHALAGDEHLFRRKLHADAASARGIAPRIGRLPKQPSPSRTCGAIARVGCARERTPPATVRSSSACFARPTSSSSARSRGDGRWPVRLANSTPSPIAQSGPRSS